MLRNETEQVHRCQIVSKIFSRSSKLHLCLYFLIWTLPNMIMMGISASQKISTSNAKSKFFIHNILFENQETTATARSLQESSTFPCQPWCVSNLTPWKHPDPTASQKCNWNNTCKGCHQCDIDVGLSEPTQSPTKPCLKWCDNHVESWATKCRWPLSCGGCSQCIESPVITPSPPSLSLKPSESTDIPTLATEETTNPTITPTIRTGFSTNSLIANFDSIFFRTTDPTATPSARPSSKPIQLSSVSPTLSMTLQPTGNPSAGFSIRPSEETGVQTGNKASLEPSITPTSSLKLPMFPPSMPSFFQSLHPTLHQSRHPSVTPSSHPSIILSQSPTSVPSSEYSIRPTILISLNPSSANSDHSENPSISPSILTSTSPSTYQSSIPTSTRSFHPSSYFSQMPSLSLSDLPSTIPSKYITRNPSSKPSKRVTNEPIGEPTESPTFDPTMSPLRVPTNLPSMDSPSLNPIMKKTDQPKSYSTMNPTLTQSTSPTSSPSLNPIHTMATQWKNATLYVNLRSEIEMDENAKKIFRETTKDFLDELHIGTDDAKISVIGIVVDAQYQTISNTNERLQILTEINTISESITMIIQHDQEFSMTSNNRNNNKNNNNNNRRNLQDFSSYLLVKIIVMGSIALSHGNIDEFSFTNTVFNAMNQETELYASKLASSSLFFSDDIENEIFSKPNPVPGVSEGSVFLNSPQVIVVGAIMGFLFIILFIYLTHYIFKKPYQKRWRNNKPISEVWPSFSSWNSSKLSLSKRHTTPENSFPCSIKITSQDSFSTLSNHGLYIRNSDPISQLNSFEVSFFYFPVFCNTFS